MKSTPFSKPVNRRGRPGTNTTSGHRDSCPPPRMSSLQALKGHSGDGPGDCPRQQSSASATLDLCKLANTRPFLTASCSKARPQSGGREGQC